MADVAFVQDRASNILRATRRGRMQGCSENLPGRRRRLSMVSKFSSIRHPYIGKALVTEIFAVLSYFMGVGRILC